MKDDILGAVIKVEKEIAEDLADEKKKAAELLEKLRGESEKEIIREKINLQQALDRAIHEAHLSAWEKAAKILEDAKSNTDMISGASDDVLKGIIRKHIVRILP